MTKTERRSYDSAKSRGTLGQEVVYGSRPATDAQMAAIRAMCKRAGYRYEGDAIRAALGKTPVGGLNRDRASLVIDHLKSRS